MMDPFPKITVMDKGMEKWVLTIISICMCSPALAWAASVSDAMAMLTYL